MCHPLGTQHRILPRLLCLGKWARSRARPRRDPPYLWDNQLPHVFVFEIPDAIHHKLLLLRPHHRPYLGSPVRTRHRPLPSNSFVGPPEQDPVLSEPDPPNLLHPHPPASWLPGLLPAIHPSGSLAPSEENPAAHGSPIPPQCPDC